MTKKIFEELPARKNAPAVAPVAAKGSDRTMVVLKVLRKESAKQYTIFVIVQEERVLT